MFSNILQRVRDFIGLVIDDVLFLMGVFFITYGVFNIYKPAGYITLGTCCMLMAYLVAKRKTV